MDISVLIVNYNTADLISACIESVLLQRNVSCEIIVMDNASIDESVSVLQKFDNKITLLANKDNLGFGKANNQGFRVCNGRYLFLLNPDAKFLSEDDLFNAVRYMDEHLDIGLAGTKIVDSNNHHVVTISNHYPRQKQSSTDFSMLPGECATVLGASMVIRREVFEKVNGFDEDFFLYAEETDLCLRIRKLGYKIGYNDQVTVCHIGSASERKSPPEQVIRRKKQAKYLFYSKHYVKSAVRAIVKKDLLQARVHKLRLLLKKQFLSLTLSEQQKWIRHNVAIDVASRFLKDKVRYEKL